MKRALPLWLLLACVPTGPVPDAGSAARVSAVVKAAPAQLTELDTVEVRAFIAVDVPATADVTLSVEGPGGKEHERTFAAQHLDPMSPAALSDVYQPAAGSTPGARHVTLTVGALLTMPDAAQFVLGAPPVNVIWVATDGDDTAAGTASAPVKTLGHAVNLAGAGTTVMVRDGVYGKDTCTVDPTDFDAAVDVMRTGTADSPLVIRAEHRFGATLDGEQACHSYFVIEQNADDLVIEGFVFTGSVLAEVWANADSRDLTVRSNRFDATDQAVFMGPMAKNLRVDGNLIDDVGALAVSGTDIAVQLGGDGAVVVNNVFTRHVHGWGVGTHPGANNVLIANNTFVFPNDNHDGQLALWGPTTNVTVRNNIFYRPRGALGVVIDAPSTGCAVDHNLVVGASAVLVDPSGCTIADNFFGLDPRFVDVGAAPYDLHLLPGSPAVDKGSDVAEVTADFDGQPRPLGPALDLGAFE